MESQDLIVTVIYVLIAMCFVAPPTEFVSAGITVQNICSCLLGSETMFFIQYHIKRTTVTLLIHSLLPFGYYLFMGTVIRDDLFDPSRIQFSWACFLLVSVVLPVTTGVLSFYWSRQKWKNHPIAQTLSHYADANSSWHSVASRINIEYRRMDKFTTGPHGRRVIVTDSWILKTTAYLVHVALQSDVHLALVSADEHALSEESNTGVQYLNIEVNSVQSHAKSFKIRLNSMEYSDLKHKISAPLVEARDVVLRSTLSDRFLQVFEEQVDLNEPCYLVPGVELDDCLGCMQKPAEIKLTKHCDAEDRGQCVTCLCPPRWCLACMGKWYASRQNQQEPETWLGSRCPCPTCRSVFCMHDVCKVVSRDVRLFRR